MTVDAVLHSSDEMRSERFSLLSRKHDDLLALCRTLKQIRS